MKHIKLFEQFTANEAWIGPFQFNDKMSDEELKKMYDEAITGYAYWQKGSSYPKSDYKKAYQEIQKILKKRGVSIDESVVNEGKLPLDKLVAMINQKYGPKPDCAEVAMFVYDNYNKVTGLNKSARNDEGYFPNEVEALIDEFGFDIDEFSDCYGRVAESTINEAKVIDRDEMIKWIQQYMKFVKTTEEFDGSTGGIWVSGENMDLFKGKRIYDYYNETRAYDLGVLSSWEKELDKRGWYSEWYDAGTVMIWQN